LEELESRVAALEREVAALRQQAARPPVEETPAERGARLIEQARLSEAGMAAAWDKALEAMGIRGEPVGPATLRARRQAEGIRPEENILSREIIAQREE
jgi:hypothetical protein